MNEVLRISLIEYLAVMTGLIARGLWIAGRVKVLKVLVDLKTRG